MKLLTLVTSSAALALPSSAQFATADAKIPAPELGNVLAFGTGLSVDGDRIASGSSQSITTCGSRGAAYVSELQPDGTWSTIEICRADTENGDAFGHSVSLQGDRLLIGAYGMDNDGVVFVYERQPDGTWTEAAEFAPDDPDNGGRFGYRVALDGDRALVGAPYRDFDLQYQVGAMYVYERQPDGTWTEAALLTGSLMTPFDHFGHSIALDGDIAVAGAPDHTSGIHNWSVGAAVAFVRRFDGTWIEEETILGPSPHNGDDFGHGVALDGERLLVGARSEDIAEDHAGAGYVFQRNAGTWTWEATLLADDPQGSELMGTHAALDGDIAVLTAPTRDEAAENSGAAHVFQRRDDGTWFEIAPFVASDFADSDYLGDLGGAGLDIDGTRFVMSSRQKDTVGALYVTDLAALHRGAPDISLAVGGSQNLLLRAGPDHAGAFYLLAGTTGGTSPGLPIPGTGLVAPLNPSAYLTLSIAMPGPPIIGPSGFLDEFGRADAAFSLPPATSPGLAGVSAHHAYALFELPDLDAVFVSNAVAVELTP